MKKKLAVILAAALSLSFAMTGCGSSESEDVMSGFYDYDLTEYVELGDYLGLTASEITAEVTDEEVQAEIQSRLEEASTYEYVTTGVVADGDTVNIDYVGKMDGEEFEGGSTDPDDGGYDLTIGSGSFIDGFESGLIGKNVGDTVVLNLTFPDPYTANEDYSGKAVEFTVTINSLRNTITPEYNLDFVTENSDCDSIEAYEQEIYDELYESAYATAESTWESDIWDRVVEGCTFLKYPEDQITQCTEDYRTYYEQYAEYMGTDFDSLLESMGTSEEDFDADAEEYAKGVVENELVLFAIAQKEDLTLTNEEYEEGLSNLITQAGFDDDAAFEESYGSSYEEYVGKENIIVTLTMDKVWNLIKESVVIEG